MEKLIKKKLGSEELVGIIPIESKRLKIKADNISHAPSIVAYLVMFLVCLLPAIFFFGFFGFILMDFGLSAFTKILVYLFIMSVLMYFADMIYVNSKKYPESALALTNSNLYYFIMDEGKIEQYNKF